MKDKTLSLSDLLRVFSLKQKKWKYPVTNIKCCSSLMVWMSVVFPYILKIMRFYCKHPQIWPTPAEFSSNPNQTHLSMLIRVFKIIRKSQVGEFDQGWS